MSSLFFFPSSFFRVFFTRTRTKNQIKRYLETSARANQKVHEGGLFPLDGLEKKCFIQAHCFRRKSRSQTTNKKLFCSRERERERERIWRRGWRVRLNSSVVEWESERERERFIRSCHRRNSSPPVPNRRPPTFFEKKGNRLARAEKKEERRERGIRKANAELSEAYIYEWE